jgi:hypothetical protein
MTPWWLAIAVSIVTALGGVIGKLWASARAEGTRLRADNEQLRHDLNEANATAVRPPQGPPERGDAHQREHVRDLRRIAGLSTSMDPPPLNALAPIIVRETAPGKRAPQRKR